MKRDVTDDDEWPYEAASVLERLWGFRIRPGELVIQPGIFSCLACGITQSFDAGERAGPVYAMRRDPNGVARRR